jgi:hypothetical protein
MGAYIEESPAERVVDEAGHRRSLVASIQSVAATTLLFPSTTKEIE